MRYAAPMSFTAVNASAEAARSADRPITAASTCTQPAARDPEGGDDTGPPSAVDALRDDVQHRGAWHDGERERREGEDRERARVGDHAFSSQTSRSPSSVRNGSTCSIVELCGATSSASPPVATTGAVRRLELATDARDDPVDLAGGAVDEPALQAADGRLPDHGRRLDEVDVDEPRGAREERLHRDLDPGGEHAADVLPLRERRRRSSSTCRSRRRSPAPRSAPGRRRR